MRYSFRLAELLGHVPDPRKRPGTTKAIVEYTGLDRHQVAALLKNEVKYIPLKALSRLCDYLIENGHATAEQLPGALFAIEPESFWELLARRKRLEICLGVRQADPQNSTEGAWVVASDSLLMGELLNGVSTLGGTAKFTSLYNGESDDENGVVEGKSPHPDHLNQTLVWAPDQGSQDEVQSRAREVYTRFEETNADRALVCLGSIKSNPLVDLVLADTFGCKPFESQDNVALPEDRSCPIYLKYRKTDPQPVACSAGTQLSQKNKGKEPGLYYEQTDGTWAHCRWDEPGKDTAFVFYNYRESLGRLDMLLGGFSGRATRLLAKTLANRAIEFWPPVYSGQGMTIGAFIVEYTIENDGESKRDILRTDFSATTKVIPLAENVIARRLLGR
ncbi:MAG: helix-turn-helix transcriptional regulator [Pirellulaceae bacterium]|nr:helix-turn-helix transcriptional regulator [Pirellulaceae bacterium]